MANQYFISQKLPQLGEVFIIENKEALHHIFTVMRTQNGEELKLVFDGGILGLAEVVDSREHSVKLMKILPTSTELPIEVTIVVGFLKADKLEFITEKATELGASAIWSASFKWSVAKWDEKKIIKKQEKLSKIALGAAEQSLRTVVPKVQLFDNLSELTEKFSEFDHVLVAYEEAARQGEKSAFLHTLTHLSDHQKLLIIFGPEGGISPEEIERFMQSDATLVGLGPRILRAETAPLFVLSAIGSYFEFFKQEVFVASS